MITILFSDNRGPLQKEEKEKIRAFIDDNSDNGSFGLSICKRMLNNSGGSIKFIENSKGCAYEISLPVFLDGGAGGDKRI
jgi:two-component sensor histidine kinase